jgi:hypothetical protein
VARVFTRAPVPFFGNFTPRPITLCRETKEEPNSVTLEIPWHITPSPGKFPYADGAIQVDLTVQGPANPITSIRSMVIDNTAVNVAVYVKFPDTSDIITVLANSVLRVAVLTQSLQFTVFTDAVFSVILTPGPITRIMVTNVYLDPLVNRESDTTIGQYLNSAAPNSSAPTYSPIGMADLSTQTFRTLTAVGSTVIDINQGYAPGRLLINSIRAYSYSAYSTSTVKEVNIGIFFNLGVFPRFNFALPVMTDLSSYGRQLLFEKSGVNWVVDNTTLLTLQNDQAVSSGTVELVTDYTLVPILPGWF